MTIFKTNIDKERAVSLLKAANIRIEEISKIKTIVSNERIIELYYDAVKEIIIAIMYCDGYKSLSHKEILKYTKEKYSLSSETFQIIDELRIMRNNISYYGKEINNSYLDQKEDKLLEIIAKLKQILEKRIKD